MSCSSAGVKPYHLNEEGRSMKRDQRGFTLIEVMITVAIVAILAAVAVPSYQQYLLRSARVQAQTELLDLAILQEKIFLNSNAYTSSVTSNYTGQAGGGLGRTSGTTNDGRYDLTVALGTGGQSFVLTATPDAQGTQRNDGVLSIAETGKKLWGAVSW